MLAEEWIAIEPSHSTMTYVGDKIRTVTVPEKFSDSPYQGLTNTDKGRSMLFA
jgi:hypothetical protein